jgi:hypothetical protein
MENPLFVNVTPTSANTARRLLNADHAEAQDLVRVLV